VRFISLNPTSMTELRRSLMLVPSSLPLIRAPVDPPDPVVRVDGAAIRVSRPLVGDETYR